VSLCQRAGGAESLPSPIHRHRADPFPIMCLCFWCSGAAPRPATSGGSGLLSGPLGDLLLASATAAAAAQHEGAHPKAEGAHPKAEGAGPEGGSEVAGQAVCLVRAVMRKGRDY
jgi:hypothetical protein